ncbi:hypothetical protein [Confluentibacter citreus]|uniref:hypothetical protein n=1 Tax=Confluentibacter citreus TaxID=2007307 RepID=UPI000C295118|nr:hypothetical protein [Confluentibacter citreus]
MGYFTRVFCSTNRKPKISGILKHLKSDGFDLSVNLTESELDDENWTDFELTYDKARLPLLVELNTKGESERLAEEELEEFFEIIGKPKFFELNKKKVIKHLKATEYIVCIQLPTSDIIDKGYDLNGELMAYIELNFSGMVQADKEGFYLRNELLFELK